MNETIFEQSTRYESDSAVNQMVVESDKTLNAEQSTTSVSDSRLNQTAT